jgi:hypothetical protein
MTRNEALELALGYAWGAEDTSGKRTAQLGNLTGCSAFAEAFADAQDDFNNERRMNMFPVSDAYRRWNETNGLTVIPARCTPVLTFTIGA